MQKFEISIPPEVIVEIEHYVDVIAQDSVVAGLKWYEEIESKIHSLDQNPSPLPHSFRKSFS
jgi:hypothetical protein